jgi:hypothetical protein
LNNKSFHPLIANFIRAMVRKKLITGMLLLVALSASLRSQETRLSYNLKTGMCCLLEIEIEQSTRSESMATEEISMFSRIKLIFRVDSTDQSGLIHMTVRYSDLLLSMLAPGMSMDINSESGKNRILSDLIDTIEQGSFHLVMKESGELHSLDGIGPLFESLAAYPAEDKHELDVIVKTLDEAYGSNAFQGIHNLFIAYYPSVQPIPNWTRDIIYYLNTKPVQMVNRYYLNRTTGELNIIQGMGMLNSLQEYVETTSMGEVKSAVSGTQTYDYQVERVTGWLRKCLSRQRVLIETTIIKSPGLPPGLRIPSYTETVFEVRGSVLQPE